MLKSEFWDDWNSEQYYNNEKHIVIVMFKNDDKEYYCKHANRSGTKSVRLQCFNEYFDPWLIRVSYRQIYNVKHGPKEINSK
jgi:hypothetical protein